MKWKDIIKRDDDFKTDYGEITHNNFSYMSFAFADDLKDYLDIVKKFIDDKRERPSVYDEGAKKIYQELSKIDFGLLLDDIVDFQENEDSREMRDR